jgi:hypothetical protein
MEKQATEYHEFTYHSSSVRTFIQKEEKPLEGDGFSVPSKVSFEKASFEKANLTKRAFVPIITTRSYEIIHTLI